MKLDRLPLNMEHDNCLPCYRLDYYNNDVKLEEVEIERDKEKYDSLPFSYVSSIKREKLEIKSDEEGEYSLPDFKLHDFGYSTNIQNFKSNNGSQSGTFDEGIDQKDNIWEVVEDVENLSVTREEQSVNAVSYVTIPEKTDEAYTIIPTHPDEFQVDSTHKTPMLTDITMYKCEVCSYETKWKRSVEAHVLIHKKTSEIEMFKCEMCNFETKQKRYLKKHMLIHKKTSEIEMFKCGICTFETKRKYYLKIHMLIHNEPSEIEMFKCEICTYESKQKRLLRRHMLIHKKAEIEMFKCEICTFETKKKDCFKNHMLLIHKKPAEIVMLKCEFCTSGIVC